MGYLPRRRVCSDRSSACRAGGGSSPGRETSRPVAAPSASRAASPGSGWQRRVRPIAARARRPRCSMHGSTLPARSGPTAVHGDRRRRRRRAWAVVPQHPPGGLPGVVSTPELAKHMSRLGPLRQREFRLLFAGRTISMLGQRDGARRARVRRARPDRLDDGPRDRARGAADRRRSCFLLFGGVWADRLPRHLVMVAVEPRQRRSQAVVAALLLTGHAQIWQLAVLAARERRLVGVLLPGEHRDRPADRPGSRCCSRRTRSCGSRSTRRTSSARRSAASSSPRRARLGDRGRRGQLRRWRRCIAAMHLPPRPAHARAARCLHELREGWHDFWSRHVALGDRAAVRDRQRGRERRDPGARAGGREEAPRRRRGVGRHSHRDVGRARALRRR